LFDLDEFKRLLREVLERLEEMNDTLERIADGVEALQDPPSSYTIEAEPWGDSERDPL
jgi:hypothetical protein